MIRPLADVTRDAIELPQDQRLILARILLDVSDLPSEPIDDVNASWEQEISDRIKAIDSGSAKGRPWEDVLKDINLRFAQ